MTATRASKSMAAPAFSPRLLRSVAAGALSAFLVASPALAEGTRADDLVAAIDVEQRLGRPLPLDAAFGDELGNRATLGSLFGQRPVVVALVYYECPMLCTLVLNGLLRAAKTLDLEIGRDYDVVVVSFDPDETPVLASAKKTTYTKAYGRPGSEDGWHFLTGERAEIERLTGALGFRYAYDAERDEYAHAAAVFVATPQGDISRYLFGVEYAPRDLKLALVEASGGKIGSLVDRLLLLCYHYDPATGRYSAVALDALRAGGIVTVVGIAGLIAALWRRDRTRGRAKDTHA